MSDFARQLVGLDDLAAQDEGADGAGEMIGIIDSGLDAEHPDFKGRIAYHQPGRAGGTIDDAIGHGTHVAGIAAGDGAASGGRIRGMAPAAELAIVGVTSDDGTVHLPPDLGELLQQAAEAGARIINLSWDTALASQYDSGSMAVDEFVRERPDVLVVIAAGNEGTAPKGYPLLYSVGTPATAKNALTVGACAGSRPGYTETWGSHNASKFPAAPTSELPLTGQPDLVAALSSRGPSDFDSIKPDIVAPGTAVLAPRASKAPNRRYWSDYAEHAGHYGFMNGTSMAAPVVSGAGAVVRQMMRKRYDREPSAALLKAVLIASARPVPWGREAAEEPTFGYPDFDQGFGRLDLRTSLAADVELWIDDVANGSERALESRALPGAAHRGLCRYRFSVGESDGPLRAVLSWTDYGQAAVQNCLALELRSVGKAQYLRGNGHHRWKQPDPAHINPEFLAAAVDRSNNVQAIGLDKAEAGDYELNVFASNTLFPPQGYALCVVGSMSKAPEAVT